MGHLLLLVDGDVDVIDFRYHLVSIIAVFLALTVGLVLGTTMLQDPLLNTLKSETADLRGTSEDLRAERDVADSVNTGADEMAESLSEDMLEERLYGLGVALVLVPGTDPEIAAALEARVEEAGGEVVGRVEISESFVDPTNATSIDELATQVSSDPEELSGTPYENAGTELARALAGGTDADGSDDAKSSLAAFDKGGIVSFSGDPAGSADAVLVLAPSLVVSSDPEGASEAAIVALDELARALRDEVGPTVLAGDTSSAAEEGTLTLVRAEDPPYSTVDVVGRPLGDIVAVLVLAAAVEGDEGAYGIGEDTRGFLPDPLPKTQESGAPDDEDEHGEVDEPDGRGLEDEARRTVPDGE